MFICEDIHEEREKKCYCCKEVKLLSYFYKNKTNKDGYHSCCINCQKTKMKEIAERLFSEKINLVSSKVCRVCKEEKNRSEFHIHRNTIDGLDQRCRSCKSIANIKSKKSDKILIKSKVCANCHKEFGVEFYHRDGSRKDGYARVCKSCAISKVSKWSNDNKQKSTFNKSRYRASKIASEPKWLTKKDISDIEFMYWFASGIKFLHGKKYQVDHIHPLKGNGFSGLHVPWNLQVISASENASKNNRIANDESHLFWGDSPAKRRGDARRGKKLTEEHKRNISEGHKARSNKEHNDG